MANQVVVSQAPQLRAVETFITDYKKLSSEDVRNLERQSYEQFRDACRKDVVKVMVEAADLGMNLEQYGNLRAPDTLVNQKRSIMDRLMEDESMYVRQTAMSAPATVDECMDGAHRQAYLFHTLTKVWDANSVQDRNTITLPTSSPLHTPPNLTTGGQPPPVAVGLRLNPGELVATSHSINTNTYSPFRWLYEKEDMQRTSVKPAQTIPASTLAEADGNIPMQKWGNRFVLPYEMLTGGQGMRVNKLAQMVALDASTESSRQYAELLGIIEKGDGIDIKNPDGSVRAAKGAAKIEPISAYDGTAGTMGFVPYLNWLDEAMEAPFQISHVIMLKAQQRQLRAELAALQGQQAFEQLSSVGLAPSRMENMEGQGGVRYGRAPDGSVTDNYVIGVDARFCVEKVNRAGMTIRQQAENIANQTRDVVISDTYLWARLAYEAVTVLNVAA